MVNMEAVVVKFSDDGNDDVTTKTDPDNIIVFDEVHIIQEIKEERMEKSALGEESHYLFNYELTGTSQSVYCNTCWAYCKDVESLKDHQAINPECKQGFQNDDNSLYESCKVDMLQSFDSNDVGRCTDVNSSDIRINSTSNMKTFVVPSEATANIKFISANKRFKCHICNKRFANRYHLNSHILIHTGVKPFTCDVCNQAFTEKNGLNKHKLIHTGEKPFTCDVCNRTFTRKSNLNSHMQLHNGERAFTCDMCDKKFIEKNGLIRHKLKHTGERPFTCITCNKTFTQSSSLNRHKIVHTGEKPFACDICNKTFNQKCSVIKHKLIHT